MMRTRSGSSWMTPVVVVAMFVALAGCGGSSGGGGTAAPPTLSGSVSGTGANTEEGTIKVTIVQAGQAATADMMAAVQDATGVLEIFGQAGDVGLVGTFDDQSLQLGLAGGGYSFTGRLAGGVISGTYTGPNGNGEFKTVAGDVIVMLGEWQFDNDFTSTCYGAAPDGVYEGWIRAEVDDGELSGDVYFPDSSGPDCATIELTEALSGNTYTQTWQGSFAYGGCVWDETTVLTLEYFDTTVAGSVITTAVLTSGDGQCADCQTTENLTGNKCVGCFPDVTCSP